MVKVAWTRLIRFVATDGRTLRGEPILPSEEFDIGNVTEADGLQAKVIIGDDIFDTTGQTIVTNEIVGVKKVLGPLAASEIPILRCVGLNYAKHSAYRCGAFVLFPLELKVQADNYEVKEAGRAPPPFPFIFFKPNTTVIDHQAPIVIPKIAQDDQADYEGEFVRRPQSLPLKGGC